MPAKHLTDTGPRAGFPICGAAWTDKVEGSMHAVYWYADQHGRDFCPACMAIMDEVDAMPDDADTVLWAEVDAAKNRGEKVAVYDLDAGTRLI